MGCIAIAQTVKKTTGLALRQDACFITIAAATGDRAPLLKLIADYVKAAAQKSIYHGREKVGRLRISDCRIEIQSRPDLFSLVQTLEPLSWITAHHVAADHALLLADITDVEEMGVSADLVGTVDSITRCPKIQGGPGRVVLTTVTHLNDFVFNLTLKNAAGQTETLGVTGYHRFYDETAGWTQTQNLHIGEKLRGDHGDLTVAGLSRDSGAYRVYNMTVEADHVYYVGNLRTLTHNICPAPPNGEGVSSPGISPETLQKNLEVDRLEQMVDTLQSMDEDGPTAATQGIMDKLDALRKAIGINN